MHINNFLTYKQISFLKSLSSKIFSCLYLTSIITANVFRDLKKLKYEVLSKIHSLYSFFKMDVSIYQHPVIQAIHNMPDHEVFLMFFSRHSLSLRVTTLLLPSLQIDLLCLEIYKCRLLQHEFLSPSVYILWRFIYIVLYIPLFCDYC